MPCIERSRCAWLAVAALLTACAGQPSSPPAAAPAPAAARATAPSGAASPSPAPAATPAAQAPATAAAGSVLPSAGGRKAARYVQLPPPATPRNTNELRLQFARRLVAAHPDTSYTTKPPERLLAIPVLEVELNADGSVRRIDVLRKPSTGDESIAIAIEAVRRAAPYGDVSRLPKPWKVIETFLFDDDLRFKPRTLDVSR